MRRYQFQSFAQYRGKLAQKTAEELDTLRTHEDVWSVLGVLNYLQALVDNSGIVAELSAPGERDCWVQVYEHGAVHASGSTNSAACQLQHRLRAFRVRCMDGWPMLHLALAVSQPPP